MKQGKPLQRKTPLKSKKPMNRGTSTLKRGNSLNSGGGLKAGKTTTHRDAPGPMGKRGHEPRPKRKPLKNKPPRTTPEERQTRKIVEVRSDGFCEKCGTPGATDKAHRISRGVGGAWCPTNILDLCRSCHSFNHANPNLAYKGGWHLRSNSNPSDSRVWFHHEGNFGWATLHIDGTHTWAEEAESIA